MYSPFKMKGKSPMMKALVGKQNNLPAELKAKIEASPAKKDKPELNQAQSDTVNSYARSMPSFQYMKKENKKKVTDSIDRLDGYRATKKEAYRQFDATDKNKTKDSATKMKKASPTKMKKASPSKMKKASATKKIGKRTVEKLPEGGKRVRVTDKEGRVKKEVIKGKGYRGVTKFDKQGREVVSKSRSGKERSKTQTKYNDFSDKPSEVKVTRKKGLLGKKTVRKAKFKKDNRDFFPS